MMKEWQSEWDEGDTGRSTFNIFPKVSLRSANWNRADVLFFTGQDAFASYLHRFHLSNSPLWSCREIVTTNHYATSCLLTTSWDMKQPEPSLEQEWYRRVASNHLSRGRIHGIIDHIHNYQVLLSQTSSDLVKPPIHQLSNPGSSQFFFIIKPFSATSTFSSASHPVKTFETILIVSSAFLPCLDKPVCVYVSFVNRELSQTVTQPSDSNKRDKLLLNNPREI
ncbi:hypothetical protein AVEN_110806-1 [Araneus ventricosus]|uniref:Uncharacterized protein n=1 Tax=Araneus ventricosus TaxID=182803 RepID=A0A4Y2GCN3_ARAVE|nr:hypothetical protein AVEN_110806-1 [Araneus ventricosus]